MRYTDSTRLSMFMKCPRARHWYTEYKGVGFVPQAFNEHLVFGSALHTGVECLVTGSTLDEARTAALTHLIGVDGTTLDGEPQAKEMAWILEGLLRVFRDQELHQLMGYYRDVMVEQELTHPLTNWLTYCTRPDLVGEHSSRIGELDNIEIKTTGWMNKVGQIYMHSLQMLMEAAIIEKTHGKPCSTTFMLAFDKGTNGKPTSFDKASGLTQGSRRDTILAYAWFDIKGKWSPTYSSKFNRKSPVWWHYKNVDHWMDSIEPALYRDAVQLLGPTHHSQSEKEATIEDIIQIEESVKAGFRPRNTDACLNFGGFGKPCPYYSACYQHLAIGPDCEYQWRVPNHPAEAAEAGYGEGGSSADAVRSTGAEPEPVR